MVGYVDSRGESSSKEVTLAELHREIDQLLKAKDMDDPECGTIEIWGLEEE